jgi:hypothetical protein
MKSAAFVPSGAPKARPMPENRQGRHRPNEVREMASLMPAGWNQITAWLEQLDGLCRAA